MSVPTKLNIGCGRTPIPDAVNLDCADLSGVDCLFDLNRCVQGDRLPFDDDTFESMLMHHVLEHLPQPLPVMQELWRVAKPGCRLLVAVPYGSSDNAFEDPTHVRQYFLDSWGYFSQAAYGGADYGYRGDWAVRERTLRLKPHWNPAQIAASPDGMDALLEIVMTHRNTVDEMLCVLEAVKPAREPGTFREEAPILFELPKER